MSPLRAAASGRLTRAILVLLVAAGFAAGALPLLSVPGYELAEAFTILVAVLGGAAGIAAVRTPAGRQWPSRAALSAGLLTASGVCAGVLVTTAIDLAARRCSPLPGLPFVLLLPLPSALLACALGSLCGVFFRRAWAAGLAYLAILFGNLGVSVWPLYAGPQAFAYSHLLGWFPGPLYDELLAPPPALWIFRGLTVVASAAVIVALACLEARRPLRRLVSLVVLAAVFGIGVLEEHRFGAVTGVSDIDRALGGLRVTAHLVLHYPAELPLPEVDRLERTAELDVEEISTALKLPAEPPIDVFFYRNAAEKGRLTGASTTHFTKPWLRQIHTHADPEGREVLRHELVHALAAPLGRAPFGVCARFGGLDVQAGIVEGLAMAVDWPADELTLHQWSRAMREAKLAPDIRTIVGPAGFLSQAQGRAYTLAGSFLRWLLDRSGPVRLARLYRDGDFLAAYGEPLDRLATDWERYVDAVPLEAEARGAAQNRFRRGSVFARPCAREMAELRAAVASAAGQPSLQARILERCSAIDPGDPAILEALWNAQSAAGLPAAAETVQKLLASPNLDPVIGARVRLAWGNDALARGQAQLANFNYQQVLSAPIDQPTHRAVQILVASLSLPAEASRAIAAYLDPRGDAEATFAGVLDVWQAHPTFAPAAYLAGLRLGQDGELGVALDYLSRALALGSLSPDATAEALRRSAGWDIDLGRYGDAAVQLAKLQALGRPPAEDVQRQDLERRLAFERRHYGAGIPGLR
ncbi:MAG TPA: hypothetical protein VMB50_15890 [Myxococcales bacterium]|nr:hypothetical protein [Myxococcales bacterium]